MARKSDGTVYVDTLMDTKGFGKGVNTMQKQMGGLGSAIGKLGVVIGSVFAVGKLIKFGKEAIDLGSDLQEVQNVVDVTFTTMNEQVNEFAKNAAESAGLSETMAKRYTGTFGAMAKAFGFAEGEAFSMSTSLTQLAGDVASFYNLTQDEAYTKLKSVFTGETESLKDLGVVMTQTALDSFAMAKGYGKTTSQMSEQEKVALRYAFVLDQLSAASGDFVRTQDSWANQTRILSLNFDSFKANIGQALINIFTPFLKVINQIVDKMAQLSQRFVAFSEMLAGKSTSSGGGSPGDALAGIESGYEDIADATDEAAKAQKKYTTGLDEIRTFQTPEAQASGGAGGIGVLNPVVSEDESVEQTESVIDRVINKITEMIKSGDWQGLGAYISDGLVGALNFLSTKLGEFDWGGLGEDIGEFIKGINWQEILESALELRFNIWESIAKVWLGTFEAAPLETAILTAFMALNLTPIGGILAGKIATAFSTGGLVSKISEVLALTFGGAGTLAESMTAIFGPITTTIAGIASIVGGVIIAVSNFFDMLKNGFSWLNEILMVLGIALAAIGAVILGAPAAIAAVIAAIVAVIATLVVIIKDNWDAICEWFSKAGEWFNTNVVKPISNFFGGLWNGIKNGASVLATFIKEKVIEPIVNLFKGMYNAVVGIVEGIVNGFIGIINAFINGINDAIDIINAIPGIKLPIISTINQVSIPRLATGAVIPPNAPFMAILGDQKHGTNIEAPLDTIKQAVREVIGNGSGGQYRFTAQINRRTLFEEVIDEAKFRQSTTGRNPFDLA